MFLTSEGKVLAAGSNSAGQCGVGKGKDQLTTPKIINYMGPDIVDVSIYLQVFEIYCPV